MNAASQSPRLEAALRRAEEDLRSLSAYIEDMRSRVDELETANAFWNSIFRHIPYLVAVKTASDLKFVHVSRELEQVLGLSRQELLGKTTDDLAWSREEAEFLTAQDRQALALGR